MVTKYEEIQEIVQEPGLEGLYNHILKLGKVLYPNYEGNPEDFVKMITERKQFEILEHGTVYLRIERGMYEARNNTDGLDNIIHEFAMDPHTTVIYPKVRLYYVTTNLGVIVKKHLDTWKLDKLKGFLVTPSKNDRAFWEFTKTLKIVTSRLKAHKLSLYPMAYIEGPIPEGELTFIIPKEWEIPEGRWGWENFDNEILKTFYRAEKDWDGREELLPLSLKTEIIMTGTMHQWEMYLDKF